MAVLTDGKMIKSQTGADIVVEKLLGEGGQGRVYKVTYNGVPKALKMYIKEKVKNLDWFRKNIKDEISSGPPSPKFIWPEDITEEIDGTFGYIMNLRPSDYVDFSELLLAKSEMSSFTAMINCAIRMVSAFSVLHFKGMCYQDLNDGNFFIRLKDGDVLVCDNDNASPKSNPSGIAGKARYMAPSVVMGGKPNYYTDRYSLAVCLFLLFVRTHPLEGVRTLNVPEMNDYFLQLCFGKDPIFIADPTDRSNGPNKDIEGLSNYFKRWPKLNKGMKDMFIRAFSKEAMKQDEKLFPDERSWQRELLRYRSLFVTCPLCGRETMLETEAITASNDAVCKCCKNSYHVYGMFEVGRNYNVPIIKNGGLFQEHIGNFSDTIQQFDPKRISVVRISSKNNLVALVNISDKVWSYKNPDGGFGTVKKEQYVPLMNGTVITIDNEKINVKMM